MGVRVALGTFDNCSAFFFCLELGGRIDVVRLIKSLTFSHLANAEQTLSMIAGFSHKRQDNFGPRLGWLVSKDPPWLMQVPVDQGRSLLLDRSSSKRITGEMGVRVAPGTLGSDF
jgi:hypothetical protein